MEKNQVDNSIRFLGEQTNVQNIMRLRTQNSIRKQPRTTFLTVSKQWEVRKLLAKGRTFVEYEFPVHMTRALNQEEIQIEISVLLNRRTLIACGASNLNVGFKNQQLNFKGEKMKDLVLTVEKQNALKLPRTQN